jgi:hypothetical protein
MTLLELARKWLRPKAEPETAEEAEEQVKFRERARQIWMAYHNDELWARNKMEAGLNLTPEALVYMERENTARRLAKEHDDKLRAELEKEDGTKLKASPAGISQPDSDNSGADKSPGEGVRGTGGPVDTGQS